MFRHIIIPRQKHPIFGLRQNRATYYSVPLQNRLIFSFRLPNASPHIAGWLRARFDNLSLVEEEFHGVGLLIVDN
jgi:hypothetical protein